MKLRLLLFEECNRACPGCCNRDWDLKNLPVCQDYSGYDQIMLTGGEPMLHPEIIREAVSLIRTQTAAPIYLYTAIAKGLKDIMPILDGVTLTLHTKEDIEPFYAFDLHSYQYKDKSLRLNIFREVGSVVHNAIWKAKSYIEWIPNCPLPEGEVLMRYQ